MTLLSDFGGKWIEFSRETVMMIKSLNYHTLNATMSALGENPSENFVLATTARKV
jgi:hypothetical protein